ncbi:MAG: hypoxanthine phosphoribosyltransferase [Oscillospiraceae bacterium]|nr:hypoxanthine phosphoribosyltransferase [Oscillospiraceae bacterium]
MHKDIQSVLFTEEQIKNRVKEMGSRISADFKNLDPIFVGILKGSFIFMSDLMRAVDMDCTVDFMGVSSYGRGSVTTGAVKITKDLNESIENRSIILIEDILDSGVTLNYLVNCLEVRKPASISIAALLNKPARREKSVKPDYIGFDVPDAFVVGYGLDYAERYRNLPYIGVLKPLIYAD